MRWCLAIHKFCYPFIFLLSRTTALALVQDFNEPRLLRHQGLVMHCPFGWGSTKRDKAKKAFTTEIIFCILLLYMEVIRWWQCSITLQKDRNEQTIRMDLRLTDRLMSFWRFFFAVCVSVCTNVTGVGGVTWIRKYIFVLHENTENPPALAQPGVGCFRELRGS